VEDLVTSYGAFGAVARCEFKKTGMMEELVASCRLHAENSKSQYQNHKQFQISNIKTPGSRCLEYWKLGIEYCLEFGVWKLEFVFPLHGGISFCLHRENMGGRKNIFRSQSNTRGQACRPAWRAD
jgi:hypothetical protein